MVLPNLKLFSHRNKPPIAQVYHMYIGRMLFISTKQQFDMSTNKSMTTLLSLLLLQTHLYALPIVSNKSTFHGSTVWLRSRTSGLWPSTLPLLSWYCRGCLALDDLVAGRPSHGFASFLPLYTNLGQVLYLQYTLLNPFQPM